MNYYPFHIGDYLSATRHLSWEEDAAFRRLLDTYYTTEKPLPAELRAVCRLVLATTESQREAVRIVLEEFFVLTPAGWINNRADNEIDAMRDKQQKQRDKANKRWHKPAAEHADAPAMLQHEEADATASKNDADAMPPTPTPTPTPTPVLKKEEGETRKRATPPVCPGDVDEQVWQDWVQLRKNKRATVSPTVIAEARIEAGKAGMPLDRFLSVWCARGSQGLMADWLKPNERDSPLSETVYQRSMRERMAEVSPLLARPAPGQPPKQDPTAFFQTVDALEMTK